MDRNSNDRERDAYGRLMSVADRRGGSRTSSPRGGNDRGPGGWFGGSEGHAEAACRGWHNR